TQETSHTPHASLHSSDDSSLDTNILSSSDSATSTSSLRCQDWPHSFPSPSFTYEVEMQLAKANQEFLSNGKLLNPSPKLKSDILETLTSEIDVAEALIVKHPCLKEQGSVPGFRSWKISLKHKMGNYRTKLRSMGCPELSINSIKNRQRDKCTSPNQVK
ncbi:hypothetical protein LDENG_00009400, partial [Lucifuga dentata]